MVDETKTLGQILSDPAIAPIAPYAIKNLDLTKNELWNKTLLQLKQEHFGGGLKRGFDSLFAAAGSGEWLYPLYCEEERAKDENLEGVNLVFFRSEKAAAADKPYILLVPGGGFWNVWNLTEGWPVAAQFSELGYNVFILTYQVATKDRRLERAMQDFARAIGLIRDRADRFGVRWDEYITCGFSAGGYLVCLWNVPEKGFAHYGLPKPRAVFPVYPLTSWKLSLSKGDYESDSSQALFGCSIEEAAGSPFEIPEHADAFPPCALFLTAEDELVSPEHSRLLAERLESLGIPCRLEIGPHGGHGFADGSGMCMEGWIKRAAEWFEALE